MANYIVAGSRNWNARIFREMLAGAPGTWMYAGSPEELSLDALERIAPRYIFFMHWSSKVPEAVVERYECVCFHMTDVPYGRGGSPLQNLIARGHRSTMLSALRMTGELDAGPVYMKRPLSLEGGAEEIYIRASRVSAEMIREIAASEPAPAEQSGEQVVFRRRKPEESAIPRLDSLEQLHDFLRMLDADGYPRAFLVHNGFRYEFSRSCLRDGRIQADVTIREERTEPE